MLGDVIEVYHAATEEISSPLADFGRPFLDFGKGFYLTNIYAQAVNWGGHLHKVRGLQPLLNKYLLDRGEIIKSARIKIFTAYDEAWLDFVDANRLGKEVWKNYDYIEGGVADDRVMGTINLLMQGIYDREEALKRLRYLYPNNQICLLNQRLIDRHLKFIESELIEI